MSRIRTIKQKAFSEFRKLSASDRRSVMASIPLYEEFCDANPELPVIPMDVFLRQRVFDVILQSSLEGFDFTGNTPQ